MNSHQRRVAKRKKLRHIHAVVSPPMSLSELARVIEAGQKGGMSAALQTAYGKESHA